MNPILINHKTGHFKRKANKLKKQSGIPHHEALDQVVQEAGYSNWEHFVNYRDVIPPQFLKAIPNPSVLGFGVALSTSVWKRPNAKMPVSAHQEVGKLLKEVYAASYFRKSVRNPVDSVRCELDEWVLQLAVM